MFPWHPFQVGDTVFYVLNEDSCHRIRKSRIAEVTKRKASRLYFEKTCYRCEDGYLFESVSSLRPYFIFTTMREAVLHVVKDLRSMIEYGKISCITARQKLDRLKASLRVYASAATGYRDNKANFTWGYNPEEAVFYIDDDDDRYVIRKLTLKRLYGIHPKGTDVNTLCCRDLGNGILLSLICKTKEEAAFRITQFLQTDISRQEIACTNAEAELERSRRSLRICQKYLAKYARAQEFKDLIKKPTPIQGE